MRGLTIVYYKVILVVEESAYSAMNRQCTFCVVAALLAGLVVACDRAPLRSATSAAMKVAVSIPPQAQCVERIGGKHVTVTVLVGSGQSPATYDPTPRQLSAMASASLYFRIGVAFEGRFMDVLSSTCPKLKIIDTRQGITRRRIDGPCNHGPGESHDHHAHGEADDPHIWLDPNLVKTQARTICKALSAADPSHAKDFERNLAAFLTDLDQLHTRLTERLAPVKGRAFFVFHPAFGYFADAYGLQQVAVETGGRSPSARQLVSLSEQAEATGATCVFIQKQFAAASAKAVADAIGGKVVSLDPLARDLLANLDEMATRIALSWGEAAARSPR